MSQSGYDVLVVGEYCCDLIFTGLPELPQLGVDVHGTGFDMVPGGAYNSVSPLHQLGVSTGWITDFGNDYCSKFVLEIAKQNGLDIALCRQHEVPYRIVSVAFSLPQDRGFITYYDPFVPPSPSPSLIEEHQPRCLLLTGLNLGQDNPNLIASARQHNCLVYLDSQYTIATLETAGVRQTLQSVDIFAPNESEALQLTGQSLVKDALSCLAELTPTVIIKCGGEGAFMQFGSEQIHVPAVPVDVVDTTGAGDSFNAGFIYAYLQGNSLDVCLQVGNICGGISTTARGSAAAAPTAEQMNRYAQMSPCRG